MDKVLGIDIGGTSIKVGLFTPEGELLEERKIPTPALIDDDAFAVVTGGLEKIVAAHDSTSDDVIAIAPANTMPSAPGRNGKIRRASEQQSRRGGGHAE